MRLHSSSRCSALAGALSSSSRHPRSAGNLARVPARAADRSRRPRCCVPGSRPHRDAGHWRRPHRAAGRDPPTLEPAECAVPASGSRPCSAVSSTLLSATSWRGARSAPLFSPCYRRVAGEMTVSSSVAPRASRGWPYTSLCSVGPDYRLAARSATACWLEPRRGKVDGCGRLGSDKQPSTGGSDRRISRLERPGASLAAGYPPACGCEQIADVDQRFRLSGGRPHVLVDGLTRQIDWPGRSSTAPASTARTRCGADPGRSQSRWRVHRDGHRLRRGTSVDLFTLGVPRGILHRPGGVRGASDEESWSVSLQASQYEGCQDHRHPHDAPQRRELPSAVLGAVPHYVSLTPAARCVCACDAQTSSGQDRRGGAARQPRRAMPSR
jgi:hypothetical protein